jgi:hypothetical protein
MTQKTHLIAMLVLLGTSISFAQDLEQHEWKDRVLIVTSNTTQFIDWQIDLFRKNQKGLKERKLIVYKVTPTQYAKGIDSKDWIDDTNFYSKIKRTQKDFEVILIGLDGGVKLRETHLVPLQKLFPLIDGMPMRRQELKNERN